VRLLLLPVQLLRPLQRQQLQLGHASAHSQVR
jgi:hypothetical protein